MKVLTSKKSPQKILKKRNLNELFEKGRLFIKGIKNSESVLLIHHTDVDGYCSGAILLAALKKLKLKILKNKNIDVVAAANEELESLLKSREINSYKKIIILDIDAPYLKKEFENFEGQILIIDHHSVRADTNSDKLVYINPRFENEELYQPVSYVAYKFLSSIIDLKDLEWVAVLGTVADLAFEDCKDLLDRWLHVKSKKDLIKTDFWRVSKMVYGVIIIGTEDVIGMLLKYKSLQDLKTDEKFLSSYSEFEKKYEKAKREFLKNAEEINNIIISKIDPQYKRTGSSLVTDIGLEKENEGKVVILLEKHGKHFKVSARSQSAKVHLGKIMEKCCASGGGHRNAAGGIIKISDFEEFKRCVLSNLT